jgi:3-hydroxyisobutyrate dehydrogenase
LDALGVGFLDCPVSGGVEGARNATLAIMAGGDESVFERAQPILSALGKTITYFGASGAGQAAKATNQIMCAGIIQAVGEAMAFAHAEGLPLDRLIETLGKGAGSSWYFVNRAPFMAKNSFPAGFRVRLHDKDLRICRDMAAQRGAHLPVVESTLQEYAKLIAAGFGDEDISSIYRLKSALFPSAPVKSP